MFSGGKIKCMCQPTAFKTGELLSYVSAVLHEGVCGIGAVMTVLSGIDNHSANEPFVLMNFFCFQ